MTVENNTLAKLRLVEEKWYDRLFKQCQQYFPHHKLPSHDHYHHLRVWYIAKDLIVKLAHLGKIIDQKNLESLIIACFFHDTGMHLSTKENHGQISRQFCETAFRQNQWALPDLFEDALDAIEYHDDKSYRRAVRPLSLEIVDILNVADDLDAFGAIGVFRYLEICLERGYPIPDMSIYICKNLENRFNNFTKLYNRLESFYEHHKKRFNYVYQFYKNLELTIRSTHYSETNFTGPIGVINYLLGILQKQKSLQESAVQFTKAASDPEVQKFFYDLNSELMSLSFKNK